MTAGWWLLGLGALVAAANGANDVSKGVATLVGSGVTDVRRALLWGAAWTLAGALAASWVAAALVATFGGGLLAGVAHPSLAAAVAAIVGAAAWVALATASGLPVSTTHALVGALAGVAATAYGVAHVAWPLVWGKVVVPLVASPVVALASTWALLRVSRDLLGVPAREASCVCAAVETEALAVGGAAVARARLRVTTGAPVECAADGAAAVRVHLDRLHWLTSGVTSFARAVNDAPKIAALALAATALVPGAPATSRLVFLVVALGMTAGSLVGGVRVTRLLATRVTTLDHHQGFAANLVTSALVLGGSLAGLPLSTTHVSTAAVVGAGLARGTGTLERRTLRDVALAWIVTLPVAALAGALACLALRRSLG